MIKQLFAIACLPLFVLAGCNSGESSGESSASIARRLNLGNNLAGHSARVIGARRLPADPAYPCVSEIDTCISMNADGSTAPLKDLCPSDDTPHATWSFQYVLYADDSCETPLDNLACIPTMREWVRTGDNDAESICITRNASSGFDFCVMDPKTGAGSAACKEFCEGSAREDATDLGLCQ